MATSDLLKVVCSDAHTDPQVWQGSQTRYKSPANSFLSQADKIFERLLQR